MAKDFNEVIYLINNVCDDAEAGFTSFNLSEGNGDIIFRTNTGVCILNITVEGFIKEPHAMDIKELYDEEFAIAFVIEEDGKRKIVGISEDGDIVYNPDNATISVNDVNTAGSYADLAYLIEEEVVSADAYEELDKMGCLLY